MTVILEPSPRDELPTPSASHVISQVIVETWIRSVDRRQGKRFLDNLRQVIEVREEMADVLPLKRGLVANEARRAEREALAAMRQMMAVWLLSLPAK